MNTILFPVSYFDFKKVDEQLQEEYNAAVESGMFDIIFFDYDKFIGEGILKISNKPNETTSTTYRGWMMKPSEYEKFYNELLNHNIKLITSPETYKNFHIFPNIYPSFKEDTAKTLIYNSGTEPNFDEIISTMDRFMIKDFVKSVKGTDFPKFFESSISKEEFDNWMKVFYKYRGELFTGGICVKEFLDLKKYDDRVNEFRVFYINNRPATISRNSGQPHYVTTPPKALIEKYSNLSSLFYTIDYAELEDGTWKVIEAGDGSVSGLSEGQDYNAFFRALFQYINYI